MTRLASIVVVLSVSLLVTSCGSDDPVAATDAGGGGVDAGGGGGTDAGGGSGTDAGPAALDAGGGGTDGGASGDTWASFGENFFATYCVDCHSVSPKDFRQLDDVRAFAPRIRCGVSDTELTGCGSGFPAPRQFPIGTGPRPMDPERARLAAWIDAGLPE